MWRILFLTLSVLFLVLPGTEGDIDAKCEVSESEGGGDYGGFSFSLAGLGYLPKYGWIFKIVNGIIDYFQHKADQEEQDFSLQWQTCIMSWIREEIDETLKHGVESDLDTMAVSLQTLIELTDQTITESVMIEVLTKIGDITGAGNDIKSKVDSANHPEEFIVPYEAALFIELTTYYYLVRVLADANYNKADLKTFIEARVLRLEEYESFIEIIEKQTLSEFFKDWKITLDRNVEGCQMYCSGPGPHGSCGHWDCRGSSYCFITTEYLEPRNNIDCSPNACGSHETSQGTSCVYKDCGPDCNTDYHKMTNGEVHAKESVRGLLSNMKAAIDKAKVNLFEYGPVDGPYGETPIGNPTEWNDGIYKGYGPIKKIKGCFGYSRSDIVDFEYWSGLGSLQFTFGDVEVEEHGTGRDLCSPTCVLQGDDVITTVRLGMEIVPFFYAVSRLQFESRDKIICDMGNTTLEFTDTLSHPGYHLSHLSGEVIPEPFSSVVYLKFYWMN